MSYQVIARKYRPQRFEDVVGQEHVTQTLANAIASKRIAHAYLFVGPRGTGKTTLARIFAKCLNCTGGPRTDFADDDSRVIEITEGRSMDVLEIDGASNNGVEQVRELRETCKYAPASAPFKIYIIDEVHMLSTAAFNALLKTLEEPPAHVKFMFATTEPEKVLATILSRCQRFDLRRIPSALIVKQLAMIAAKEGVQIEDAALQAIARGANGGMRDAESTLDQLISFCGNQIAEADVLSMFGLAAQSQIFALTDAILDGSAEPALRQLNDLARQGKELGRIVSELLGHFRNLLIFQVAKGDLNLIEASETEAAVLARQSARIGTDALARIMEVLADCEGRLRDAVSKKILLEVTLLRVIEVRDAVSIDTVLKHLRQLKNESGSSTPVQTAAPVPTLVAAPVSIPKPAPPVAAPVAPARPAPAAVSETPLGEADLKKLWDQLLEAVGRARPLIRTYLTNAFPVSLVKGILTVGFDPEDADQMSLVDTPVNHTLFQTKLTELRKTTIHVKIVKTPAPPGFRAPPAEPEPEPATKVEPAPKPVETPAPAPAATPAPAKSESIPFDPADFKNDPLIQKALEVFKGRIIDVRS